MRNYKIEEIEIYTDGSCRKRNIYDSTGCIGWSYIALRGDEILRQDSGFLHTGTNNRAELTAVIEAIDAIEWMKDNDTYVTVYSDSVYVVNGMRDWMPNLWMKNGWVNAKKQTIENKDMWLKLMPYIKREDYRFEKVSAHQNNFWNNYVDRKAQQMAERAYKLGATKNERRFI